MEAYLNNKKWVAKNSCFLLWMLVPLLYCLSWFHMWRKTSRVKYLVQGLLFAMFELIQCIGYVLDDLDLYDWSNYYGPSRIFITARYFVMVLCLILLLAQRKDFLRLLAYGESIKPVSHLLLSNKKWAWRNSIWMIWCLIPGFGGFSLLHAGVRTKTKQWIVASVPYFMLLILYVVFIALLPSGAFYSSTHTHNYALLLPLIQLFHCGLMRKSYLGKIAANWQLHHNKYDCLNRFGWRMRQGWWFALCFVPGLSWIGIVYAGIYARKKAWILACICNGVILLLGLVLYIYLTGGYVNTDRILPFFLTTFLSGNSVGLAVLHCSSIFIGGCIYEPFLQACAIRHGGCQSLVEKELADKVALEKFKNRPSAPVKTVPAVAPTVEPKLQQPKPVQTPKVPLDINICSPAELATLPGLSQEQIAQALTHRQQQNGFRSVDEFVDVLSIKPHIAVKLFPLIVVSKPAPVFYGETRRRTLDI